MKETESAVCRRNSGSGTGSVDLTRPGSCGTNLNLLCLSMWRLSCLLPSIDDGCGERMKGD